MGRSESTKLAQTAPRLGRGRGPPHMPTHRSLSGGSLSSPFVGAARWAARARHHLAPTRPGPVSFHPSWCRQAWVADVRLRSGLLLALTLTAGAVDAVSYLGLGRVFTA